MRYILCIPLAKYFGFFDQIRFIFSNVSEVSIYALVSSLVISYFPFLSYTSQITETEARRLKVKTYLPLKIYTPHLYSLNRILTITLAIVAIIAISLTVYIIEENVTNSYNSEISYEITKLPIAYDYSCDTNDTAINVVLSNKGTKDVADFTVSVTNPVCVSAVPDSLPSIFNQSSTLRFTVYSNDVNGTITVAGNYTLVSISF